MKKNESDMDDIRCKISSLSHLALHVVVLGDGEEKPAEDRPHWQEGNGSLRVRKLFQAEMCCALIFDKKIYFQFI